MQCMRLIMKGGQGPSLFILIYILFDGVSRFLSFGSRSHGAGRMRWYRGNGTRLHRLRRLQRHGPRWRPAPSLGITHVCACCPRTLATPQAPVRLPAACKRTYHHHATRMLTKSVRHSPRRCRHHHGNSLRRLQPAAWALNRLQVVIRFEHLPSYVRGYIHGYDRHVRTPQLFASALALFTPRGAL